MEKLNVFPKSWKVKDPKVTFLTTYRMRVMLSKSTDF